MPFPTNPTPGQTHTEDNTTWVYAGPVNGWYRRSVSPGNSSTFTVGGSASATGAAGEIQYTDGTNLAASPNLVWDDVNDELEVGGDVVLDDGGTFTTTLQTITPTANRTVSLPNATGTVALVAGSSGQLVYNNAGAQAGVPGSVVGATGNVTLSLNGAASVPPFAVTGSWFAGTTPQVLIQPSNVGTAGAWSASGTGIGVNAVSGFGGRLLDLQVNGTSRAVVTGAGDVGIGTTSPVRPLDLVSSTVNNSIGLKNSATGSGIFDGFSIQSTSLNVGLHNFEAGHIYFATSDTERARIDSSGRLLVGTSTSRSTAVGQGNFQLEADTPVSTLHSRADNAFGAAFVIGKTRGSANQAVVNGDVLGIISFQGGNGSTMLGGADITAVVDGAASGGGANDLPTRLVFGTTADGAGSPTERMRISSTGFMLLGTTSDIIWNTTGSGVSIGSNSIQVSRSGDACVLLNRTSNDGKTQIFARQGAEVGSITVTTSTTAYNTSSDYRLKENVAPVTNGITRLQELKPSRFNFIADPDKTVDGFIAHEAQAVVPECVTGTKDEVDDHGNPVYQGIDQSKLVPLLTAALQEAISEIESLKARLTAAGI